jgi:hypothetical protein
LKGLPTGQRDLGADRLQLFQDADLLDRLEVVGTVVMFGFGSQAVQLGYERRDVSGREQRSVEEACMAKLAVNLLAPGRQERWQSLNYLVSAFQAEDTLCTARLLLKMGPEVAGVEARRPSHQACWFRRNCPKCGTVNATVPRSEE